MKILFKAIFLIVLLTSVVSARSASARSGPDSTVRKSVILTDARDKYPLGLYLELLEDPGAELTIEDVTSPEYATRFVPSQLNVSSGVNRMVPYT